VLSVLSTPHLIDEGLVDFWSRRQTTTAELLCKSGTDQDLNSRPMQDMTVEAGTASPLVVTSPDLPSNRYSEMKPMGKSFLSKRSNLSGVERETDEHRA